MRAQALLCRKVSDKIYIRRLVASLRAPANSVSPVQSHGRGDLLCALLGPKHLGGNDGPFANIPPCVWRCSFPQLEIGKCTAKYPTSLTASILAYEQIGGADFGTPNIL